MLNLNPERLRPQIEAIQQVVADAFGLKVRDLIQGSTTRDIAIPRQIAMYLVRQLTDASVLEIGRMFERHHTTVVHAIAKMEEERRTSSEVEATINQLCRVIASK